MSVITQLIKIHTGKQYSFCLLLNMNVSTSTRATIRSDMLNIRTIAAWIAYITIHRTISPSRIEYDRNPDTMHQIPARKNSDARTDVTLIWNGSSYIMVYQECHRTTRFLIITKSEKSRQIATAMCSRGESLLSPSSLRELRCRLRSVVAVEEIPNRITWLTKSSFSRSVSREPFRECSMLEGGRPPLLFRVANDVDDETYTGSGSYSASESVGGGWLA
ncbi:hypothetical protein OGATHE_003009 [Ogataea polymorpha]|uniref:Uncharacterized protein n=1 Tax=Ogataea polymorpha TaxID=460523 RepID=A0A9P8PE72_9ASCO|nr:hypothetical protein OGATHE_003009 [Ogataea polymorpha]